MKRIHRLEGFVGGAMVGAGLMFLLDPTGGRRRRHLIQNKLTRARHDLADTSGKVRVRVRNRVQGVVAETRSRFSSQDVADSVLEARVRSSIGRVVSNPGAISVVANERTITISGPVLASEVKDLLDSVKSVPGVRDVHSQLSVEPAPNGISGLQGTDRPD